MTGIQSPNVSDRKFSSEKSTSDRASHKNFISPSQKLQPGIYKVVNMAFPNIVMDLSGADNKSLIGFSEHGWANQQWEFIRLGAGYSIRSILNSNYLTVETGLENGDSVVASPFPVSWALEEDNFEEGIWRICWPGSSFLFDFATDGSNQIKLSNRYPFESTCLWRLVKLPLASETTDASEMKEVNSPSTIKADTIVDAEGLKLGGNGELAITTTTTTTTVSVTRVQRVSSL